MSASSLLRHCSTRVWRRRYWLALADGWLHSAVLDRVVYLRVEPTLDHGPVDPEAVVAPLPPGYYLLFDVTAAGISPQARWNRIHS